MTESPGQVVKHILLDNASNADYPWWFRAGQAMGAAIVAWWVALPAMESWLLKAMILDLVTGTLAALWVEKRGGLKARALTWGMAKKVIVFYLVTQAKLVPGAVQVAGVSMTVHMLAGSWWLLGEVVSNVENLDDLGVQLPPFARRWLAAGQAKYAEVDQALGPNAVREPVMEEKARVK